MGRSDSMYEGRWIDLAVEIQRWMDKYTGIKATTRNMGELLSSTQARINEMDYMEDEGGIIRAFGLKCDRELNPDEDDPWIRMVMSVILIDGERGSDVRFTIDSDNVAAEYTSIEAVIKQHGDLGFDPIEAYNRAMGIVDPRA